MILSSHVLPVVFNAHGIEHLFARRVLREHVSLGRKTQGIAFADVGALVALRVGGTSLEARGKPNVPKYIPVMRWKSAVRINSSQPMCESEMILDFGAGKARSAISSPRPSSGTWKGTLLERILSGRRAPCSPLTRASPWSALRRIVLRSGVRWQSTALALRFRACRWWT